MGHHLVAPRSQAWIFPTASDVGRRARARHTTQRKGKHAGARMSGLSRSSNLHSSMDVLYYPLVNVHIAMENHHFEFGKSTNFLWTELFKFANCQRWPGGNIVTVTLFSSLYWYRVCITQSMDHLLLKWTGPTWELLWISMVHQALWMFWVQRCSKHHVDQCLFIF